METNGIIVTGAGSAAVQGTYFCDEMGFSGYKRTWTNTNKEVMIFAEMLEVEGTKTYTWKFSDLNKQTIYYHAVSLDGLPVANPWDRNAGWTIGETELGVSPIPLLEKFNNPNIVVEVGDPVEEYDEETNEKIVTVVTTYTDASTGNVRSETNVTREKVIYKTKEVERGLQPNIAVGKVYRFSFIGEFKSLGYVPKTVPVDTTEEQEEEVGTDGIYELTKTMSFYDLLAAGIDLFENLYKPLGLTKDLYEYDQPNIQSGPIYELTNPADNRSIIYMPCAFVDGTPDSSVEEFNRLMLIMDLGFYADVSIVAELEEIVSNTLLCKFGMDNRTIKPGSITEEHPEGEPNPNQNVNPANVVTGESKWMHTDEYAKLNEARAIIQKSEDSVQAYNWLTNKLADHDMFITFTKDNVNDYIGRMILIDGKWTKITPEMASKPEGTEGSIIGKSFLMCVSAATYRDINRKLLTQIDAYEDIIQNGKQVGVPVNSNSKKSK